MSKANSANPLLGLAHPLPFDAIVPAHIEPAIDALLTDAAERLAAIGQANGPPDYQATFGALDDATTALEEAMGIVVHLEGLMSTPGLREAYNAVQPKVSAFYSAIPHDPALWKALRAFAESKAAGGLAPVHARFVERTVDEFRRHGADLDAEAKARLQAIDVELSTLTTRFAQNVADSTDAFEWTTEDEAQLAGLPESVVAAARDDAMARGQKGWRFTLQAPSLTPLLTYLDDGAVRERFYRAYNTRGVEAERDNRPLIDRILALRQEKARLLGYADFADLMLESRMVRTGDAAWQFVDALRARSEPFFRAEHAELEAFRRELEGADAPKIMPWDLSYYAEKMRKARYDLDEEALRPYFAVEQVLSGLFEIVHRLYGVTVRALADVPVWHDDVRVYALDDADGTRLGVFYTDLFPRPGKRGGAWMRSMTTGAPAAGTPHIGAICGNLTPPSGGKPALLRHHEVETIFHEFGHLLHHLLSNVPVRGLAGTNVAWDFVELPSQIMENWCFEREGLDLFARHFETGEPLPAALFERMQAARTFRGGYAMMRQLGFATVDLALHRGYDPKRDGDVLSFALGLARLFNPTPLPDDYAMIASFAHLFAHPVGYAAAYYSYKWAEVLDADAFTRFAAEGLFSRKVGLDFRRNILEAGDSRDPMALYTAFMGREPDQTALLVRAGLAA